jgi:hypothetical protein
MWHSCDQFSLEALFEGCQPHVFEMYQKYEAMARACGPITVNPKKTGIAFQVRVRFGGCQPRKSHLNCTVALPRRFDHPRFFKIETYSPRFIAHRFRIYHLEELDEEVQGWLCEAYDVGAQKWLFEEGKRNE